MVSLWSGLLSSMSELVDGTVRDFERPYSDELEPGPALLPQDDRTHRKRSEQ